MPRKVVVLGVLAVLALSAIAFGTALMFTDDDGTAELPTSETPEPPGDEMPTATPTPDEGSNDDPTPDDETPTATPTPEPDLGGGSGGGPGAEVEAGGNATVSG